MAKIKICGIYGILSLVHPERCYVGSSSNINTRWNLHRNKLKKDVHHTPKLQSHYNKYGLNDLVFIVLEQFDFISREHIEDRENFYMRILSPWFNSRLDATSNVGFKMTAESCLKISKGNKGKPKSEEHKRALSEAWEKRRLIPDSDETRKKKSEASKRRKTVWSTGLTKETDERILKISEDKKGRAVPQEIRDKISKELKGKPHSDEHNRKVGEANKGKKRSPETIAKQSLISKETWRKKKEAQLQNQDT